MVQLKKVGVLSAAKISAFIQGVIGILVIPIFLLVGAAQMAALPAGNRWMGGFSMLFALILPFLYAAMGFIFGAIAAFIYNWVAGRFGGLELEFSGTALTTMAIPPV